MMVQGRQKSLNSLWGLPSASREPDSTKTPKEKPTQTARSEKPANHGKLTFALPKELLEELQTRDKKNEEARDPKRVVLRVSSDQLRILADRKPPPKKVVHPFFSKKQKKAPVTETPVSTPAAPKTEHVVTQTPHVTASISSVKPPNAKPRPMSFFGIKKEKKKQTTPFPSHELYHVTPIDHMSTPPEQLRLAFQKRYSRSVSQAGKNFSEGTLHLPPLPAVTEETDLYLPTRHVMITEEVLDLAVQLSRKHAESPAIKSLLARVTNLSAFDTADRETQMWVDKYRPKSRNELVGGQEHVTNIVSWLKQRLARRTVLTKSHSHVTPSSDNFIVDDDVINYDHVPENDPLLLILSGPTSSGKKACLLAACQELELFVFKLNATTRRTQKELLSALQGLGGSQLVNHKQKSCIILIEDVDVLYEDEKGFWGVLEKVLEKSKVPVVLTTTDVAVEREFPASFEGCVVWETFERDDRNESCEKSEPNEPPSTDEPMQSQDIGLRVAHSSRQIHSSRDTTPTSRDTTPRAPSASVPPSSPPDKLSRDVVSNKPDDSSPHDLLATYLSLICLCEGYDVSISATSRLLSRYSLDIRQTINHLQFWCQMGVGDPLGGFNWVLPISEGEGRRVISMDMYVGDESPETYESSYDKSHDQSTGLSTLKSMLSSYEADSYKDIYTNALHSQLEQTMSRDEHEALAHDTPLGWRCLEEDSVGESDLLEWEESRDASHVTEAFEPSDSYGHSGNVRLLNSYADRIALKNLLFDDCIYYSQINTVSMATARAQILPYLRHMAQADLFYQNQFELQQATLTGRKSRRSMAAMGISIPVTHLEWDLDAIMDTKLDVQGLYEK